MHVVAAKAVAFGEAQLPEFKDYAQQVVANAQIVARTLSSRGFGLVSGGTDTHLVLVDLRTKGLTGKAAEKSLERAHLTCSKNRIPFDPQTPAITSGIRLGTPAGTTRGFKKNEFAEVAGLIADVLDGMVDYPEGDKNVEERAKQSVLDLCRRFPIFDELTEGKHHGHD